MRSWSDDHPKAKLMARKSAAILAAARDAFLDAGFAGATMEAIAAGAGVSIMTLYRHARTKDELFAAVVSEACEPPAGGEQAQEIEALRDRPLVEILAYIGGRVQDRLGDPATLGLLRAVMAEHRQFPQLGAATYDGLVASHEEKLVAFLAGHPETASLDIEARTALAADFFDRLIGANLLKALLGLPLSSEADRRRIARQAAEALVASL